MRTGPNQPLGYVFGALYVAVGMLGFAVTGGLDVAATEGAELIIFEVNPLHNAAHIAIGALLLSAARSGVGAAEHMNVAVGIAYLALGIAGFFLIDTDQNVLALNQADNGLHMASAAVLLAVGVFGRASRQAATG